MSRDQVSLARRAGPQTVQVHRLLSDVGADQRLVQVLRAKTALFAEFAAISETADAAPDALDVRDAGMLNQIVREEQERLFGSQAVHEREEAVLQSVGPPFRSPVRAVPRRCSSGATGG